jgi:hypothetical protein
VRAQAINTTREGEQQGGGEQEALVVPRQRDGDLIERIVGGQVQWRGQQPDVVPQNDDGGANARAGVDPRQRIVEHRRRIGKPEGPTMATRSAT